MRSFLQSVGLPKGWMEMAVAAFTPVQSQRGERAAGSLMDCYLLKGTSPCPRRCPRGSWGTEATDRRAPRAESYPPQRSSPSALRGLHGFPARQAASFQGTPLKARFLLPHPRFLSRRTPLRQLTWLVWPAPGCALRLDVPLVSCSLLSSVYLLVPPCSLNSWFIKHVYCSQLHFL